LIPKVNHPCTTLTVHLIGAQPIQQRSNLTDRIKGIHITQRKVGKPGIISARKNRCAATHALPTLYRPLTPIGIYAALLDQHCPHVGMH
jgi:hypothetical protein